MNESEKLLVVKAATQTYRPGKLSPQTLRNSRTGMHVGLGAGAMYGLIPKDKDYDATGKLKKGTNWKRLFRTLGYGALGGTLGAYSSLLSPSGLRDIKTYRDFVEQAQNNYVPPQTQG
jgi:hypothetical protein